MTRILKETIMGRLLPAAALFVATMSVTVSLAATGGPFGQAEPSAVTQYQDPN